mmetsp:Transcript_24221/g.45057  ORF Transcript_24221/g.45057 Transcript_24221/m.45057 type:complete len:242 (+) Transcript_24221:201-926(+)
MLGTLAGLCQNRRGTPKNFTWRKRFGLRYRRFVAISFRSQQLLSFRQGMAELNRSKQVHMWSIRQLVYCQMEAVHKMRDINRDFNKHVQTRNDSMLYRDQTGMAVMNKQVTPQRLRTKVIDATSPVRNVSQYGNLKRRRFHRRRVLFLLLWGCRCHQTFQYIRKHCRIQQQALRHLQRNMLGIQREYSLHSFRNFKRIGLGKIGLFQYLLQHDRIHDGSRRRSLFVPMFSANHPTWCWRLV